MTQTYTITRPEQYQYEMADSNTDKEERKREVCSEPLDPFRLQHDS
jgi:hypothetical protein